MHVPPTAEPPNEERFLFFNDKTPKHGFIKMLDFIPNNKRKVIPLQAWTGPEGSRRLRLPDFKTIGT